MSRTSPSHWTACLAVAARTIVFAAFASLSVGRGWALDLDEPGGPKGATASAPLPAPDDRYAPVHGKPHFLSDAEWAGIQSAAKSASDPAHETARMVAYLHFQKTYFQWQQLQATQPTAAHKLAWRLLHELPTRVAEGLIGAEQAQQLQARLIPTLTKDPARQAHLMADQAKRLPPQPSAPPAFAN